MALFKNWSYEKIGDLDEDSYTTLLAAGINRLIAKGFCRNATVVSPNDVTLPLGDKWLTNFVDEQNNEWGVLFSQEAEGLLTVIGPLEEVKKRLGNIANYSFVAFHFSLCGCGAPAVHGHHGMPCCGGSMCCPKANE